MDKVEKALGLSAVKTSKIPDAKNIFKREDKQNALMRRYGRELLVTVSYEMNGSKIKELTQQYQSANNKVYSITEYFKDDETTDFCILSCRRNGRNFEYRFERFIDAEVSMIDIIAEEEDGDIK